MSFQAPVADKGDIDTNAASPASTTACVLGPAGAHQYHTYQRGSH
jgi:hypothetical protein